jgi:hypothetical protein
LVSTIEAATMIDAEGPAAEQRHVRQQVRDE